jgi:hypothetical protein
LISGKIPGVVGLIVVSGEKEAATVYPDRLRGRLRYPIREYHLAIST